VTDLTARNVRRAAKGLPVYIACETCDGTGLVISCPEGCTVNGAPGYAANRSGDCCGTVDCAASGCFDGELLCADCDREGAKPRVEVQGPNYIVAHLATQIVDGEPLCERHAKEWAEPTVTAMVESAA
jgi:hypothetical protein